jgi:hypothetical protein|tara:strand:+ start:77 stop:241 length:165 start_codon:yes stop_codon:yes gene_type:complete
MYKTLKLLQDQAEASDNIWLTIKLKTLETEIFAELKEAEDRVKSYYNEVILKQY